MARSVCLKQSNTHTHTHTHKRTSFNVTVLSEVCHLTGCVQIFFRAAYIPKMVVRVKPGSLMVQRFRYAKVSDRDSSYSGFPSGKSHVKEAVQIKQNNLEPNICLQSEYIRYLSQQATVINDSPIFA